MFVRVLHIGKVTAFLQTEWISRNVRCSPFKQSKNWIMVCLRILKPFVKFGSVCILLFSETCWGKMKREFLCARWSHVDLSHTWIKVLELLDILLLNSLLIILSGKISWLKHFVSILVLNTIFGYFSSYMRVLIT